MNYKFTLFLLFFSLSILNLKSQNVGIGTNIPLSKLHVAGAIRSDTLIGPGVRSLFASPNGRIYDSLVAPSALNWQISGNSNITALNFLGTTNANDVIFKTNNIERARILSGGGIGFGTSTLDFLSVGFQVNNGEILAGDAGGLLFKDPAAAVGFKYWQFRPSNITSGDFVIKTLNDLGVTQLDVMSITRAGNIGIGGTLLPGNKLEITSGSANSSGLRFTNLTSASPTVITTGKALSVDANGDVILIPAAAASNAWDLLGNAGTTPGTNFLGTTDAKDLVIKTNNTEKVRVLTTGQIGIGTPAPNASAIVQIISANQGVMFPSLTSAQRIAIVAPAVGLMVYDLTANILMNYNGTRWQEVGGNPIGSIEAFHKNMASTPVLPWGWVECNGQVLADAESPYNGQNIPLLNANEKFLRGSAVSGVMQTEDLGSHSHTGTTALAGTHNHTGSTGAINSNNGRVVPWDDNLQGNKMNAANTGQLINTPPGGGGIPYDGLATVGNFITTIDQLAHTHIISNDGNHNHTFTTNNAGGTETRPTNMSVVWIIRVK